MSSSKSMSLSISCLAWTELTKKSALSEAQDVPNKYSGVLEECKAYLQAGQSESTLTNILNRKKSVSLY